MKEKISLVFEDNTIIDIPIEQVTWLSIDGVTKSIIVTGDLVTKLHECKDVLLTLKPGANVPYHPFDLDEEDDDSVFDRITQYSDITSVIVKNTGYQVPWKEDKNSQENAYQRVIPTFDGGISISIKKRKDK